MKIEAKKKIGLKLQSNLILVAVVVSIRTFVVIVCAMTAGAVVVVVVVVVVMVMDAVLIIVETATIVNAARTKHILCQKNLIQIPILVIG